MAISFYALTGFFILQIDRRLKPLHPGPELRVGGIVLQRALCDNGGLFILALRMVSQSQVLISRSPARILADAFFKGLDCLQPMLGLIIIDAGFKSIPSRR